MAILVFRFIVVFTVAPFCLGPNLHLSWALDIPDIEQPIQPSLTLWDPVSELIVIRGQNASLKCPHSALDGVVNVTWYYNRTLIGQNDSRWAVLADGTLYFPKVPTGKKAGRSVAGEYYCAVENEAGRLVSNPVKVKVAAIDKEVNQTSTQVTVTQFQPLLLSCHVRSTPAANVHWEFKSDSNKYIQLPQNTSYVPLPNGALLISKSQVYDTGYYRCIAENMILNKTKYSKDINVKILAQSYKNSIPLEFLTLGLSPNVTVLLGDEIRLFCAVKGWPTPKIQWINNDGVVVQNSTVLKIYNAKFRDSGNYTCMAHNSEGRIFQKYVVNVFEKPSFNVTPMSTRSPAAKIVRLDCQARGVPKPKVHWLKDGQPLKIEWRIKKQWSGLVLSHTFTSDSGMYQCVATNAVGRIWASAEIQIDNSDSPPPPQNVQCRTYDANSICLTWSPPSDVDVKAYTVYSFYYKSDVGEVSGPEYLTPKTNYLCDGLNDSTNYTFYIRLYSNSASDQSDKVTCQTGVTGSRNIDVELVDRSTVLLKWNKLNTDTFCNGSHDSYKVFWRPFQQDGGQMVTTNVVKTTDLKYVVNDLTPGTEYEFKITSEYYGKEPDGGWTLFPMPDIELSTSPNDLLENDTVAVAKENVPETPKHLEASAIELNEIQLKWDLVPNAKYYTVCYVAAKDSKKSCETGETLKSFAGKLAVPKLKTNTQYQFRVRAHNSKGFSGNYSKPIQIRTLQDVPSAVLNLKYKIVNSTTACISWRVPANKNGKIIKYVVSYTPDPGWLLENWLRFSVQSRPAIWCDVDDAEVVSTYFGNLTEGKQYTIMVQAENDVGLGKPTVPIYVKVSAYAFEGNKGEGGEFLGSDGGLHEQQKIGIIVGVILALTCIVCCVLCIVLRKRWLKRRALAQARLAAATNFYAQVAHYGPEPMGGGPQLRLEDRCGTGDIHEMERFLEAPHIPPNASGHLDTKGVDNKPNGSVNGPMKPYLNGHVHITENPQYYAFECNGNVAKPTKRPATAHSHTEEDSNSNVKSSKFYDLHRLFENTKKSKNLECDPHFDSGNSVEDSGDSNEDVPLDTAADVTQITCLDHSVLSNRSNHRRLSPLLGPNG